MGEGILFECFEFVLQRFSAFCVSSFYPLQNPEIQIGFDLCHLSEKSGSAKKSQSYGRSKKKGKGA